MSPPSHELFKFIDRFGFYPRRFGSAHLCHDRFGFTMAHGCSFISGSDGPTHVGYSSTVYTFTSISSSYTAPPMDAYNFNRVAQGFIVEWATFCNSVTMDVAFQATSVDCSWW
eukprot:Gb_13684 [translate_table: standard]